MTDFTARITKPELFMAAARCISNEETRYYLRGVFIQPHPVRGVYLISTDGHRMIRAYDEEGTASRAAIITPPSNKMPTKWKGKGRYQNHLLFDGKTVSLEEDGIVKIIETAGEIDGTFPDWTRVMPDLSQDEVLAQFNSSYLGDMAAISKLLGEGDNPYIRHHGDGPAAVFFGHRTDIVGIQMPCRPNNTGSQSSFPGDDVVAEPAMAAE